MWRATWKGLMAHKVRLFATGLAVLLGVAFMAGTLVLADTVDKSFDDLFVDIYAGTDAVVRGEAVFEQSNQGGPSFQARPRVDASLVDDVAEVDGVAVADGLVQGYTQLVDRDGDPIGNPAMGAPTFGSNWSDNDDLNPFDLVEGEAPRSDDEVVIDKASADQADYAVGDRATVITQAPPTEVRIAGIAKFGEADSPLGASFVLFTDQAAQRLVAGEPGKFDEIDVVAAQDVSRDELVRRLEAALPESVEVVTGDEITRENQDDIGEALTFFRTFMSFFAAVALVVGAFIIHNTFSIIVAQRTRENALLRALGASRRQVLGSVLAEALVIGVLASLAGLVAGVAVAAGLKALLSGFGFDIPATGVVITPTSVVLSLVIGLVITVLATMAPARRASRIPPVAAMRDVAFEESVRTRRRLVTGLVVVGLGVLSLANGLVGGGFGPIALGALLVLLGVAALGPMIARPLSRIVGAPLPRLRGVTGQLARENAMRNPRRTAATAAALMVGMAIVGSITIFAASAKASFADVIDEAFTGDLIVESGNFGFGGFSPSLAEEINELPEVAAASGLRFGQAEIDGDVDNIAGIDPDTMFDIIDVEPLRGEPADLDEDGLAVFEETATDHGWDLGDRVPVRFKDTGTQELTVAMIYGEDDLADDYFVGLPAYQANFADQFDAQVYVKKAEDATFGEARAAVEGVARRYPGAEVLDQDEFAEEQTGFLDQMLGLTYVLLGLAILIALLGIANTLALSQFERIREIGLMRAVGMTRAQLRSAMRWEGAIIAVLGTLLGLVIGLFFGWSFVVALDEVNQFQVPFGTLIVIAVLAGLAGLLASVLPARRAARLDVLAAIATE